MNLPSIKDADLKGKTVLLRADVDVTVTNKKISDDFRLKTSLETLNYLLENASKVIICGHLGRPKGKDESLSLEIVADWYAKNLNGKVSKTKLSDFDAFEILPNLVLLENLRFDPGEEVDDPDFSKKLSLLAQVYVNDAFASSHRKHASIYGAAKLLPHFAGLHLEKEVEELSKVLENPVRPLTVIIGGAKIETKLPLVSKMHKFADYVLVGGELVEEDKVLLRVAHQKEGIIKSILFVADLTADGKDITEYSTQNFIQIISRSKTIVWNGPMGQFEQCFDQGTRELAQGIAESGAYSVVGGGNTVEFLEKEGLMGKFSFVSTGGGAMLEFLAGEKLPGLEVLEP